MPLEVWVGLAIVAVLIVLVFVKDRTEGGRSGHTATLTPNDAIADTMASSTDATVVAGDRSSMFETVTPYGRPSLGCRLNVDHLWRWEYPPEGRKFGRCQKCGKINDNWVGSNWRESWAKAMERRRPWYSDGDGGGSDSGGDGGGGDGGGGGGGDGGGSSSGSW